MSELFPTTKAKDQRIFDAVMTAINARRSKGILPVTISAALRDVGIGQSEWNNTWARTRKRAPHMSDMMTRAVTSVGIIEEPQVPEEPVAKEVDETPPTKGEVIDQITAWVEKVAPEDRPRVMEAAAILMRIGPHD